MASKKSGTRDFDRTFIQIGKACSGKSTLGNLLLGKERKDGKIFEMHEFHETGGVTEKVNSGESVIEASRVYDQCNTDETLKIQVIDQPGSNDCDLNQENFCKFLKQCVAESKAEMSATFLILIDLDASFFTLEELITLLNLAQILSDSGYSFFPKMIVIFTHADKIDKDLNEDCLEKSLQEKLGIEEFACIKDLLDLADQRYIFINGVDWSDRNRYDILKKLFFLSRPNINVYINGNNYFKAKDFKSLFGEDMATKTFDREMLKYDVRYNFNPDLNLFKKFEKQTVEDKIASALEKLSGITKGISAMVLLINLENTFNNEVNNLILNLPKTYNLGKEFKKDFWNYACILFKAPVDNKDYVKRNVEKNRLLKNMDIKVNSRYCWVTSATSPVECSRRVTDLVRRVKQDTEGKIYTDSVVLGEMKQCIKESSKLRKTRRKTRIVGDIEDAELCKEIPCYKLGSDSKVVVEYNDFFWKKETISPMIGYFILKNINSDMGEKFRKDHPDKDGDINTEAFAQYCLDVMEK